MASKRSSFFQQGIGFNAQFLIAPLVLVGVGILFWAWKRYTRRHDPNGRTGPGGVLRPERRPEITQVKPALTDVWISEADDGCIWEDISPLSSGVIQLANAGSRRQSIVISVLIAMPSSFTSTCDKSFSTTLYALGTTELPWQEKEKETMKARIFHPLRKTEDSV